MSENPIINHPTEGEETSPLVSGSSIIGSLKDNPNVEPQRNIEEKEKQDDSIKESLQIGKNNTVTEDTNVSVSITNARKHPKDSIEHHKDSVSSEDIAKIHNDTTSRRGRSDNSNSTLDKVSTDCEKIIENNSNNMKSISDIRENNSSVECFNQIKQSSISPSSSSSSSSSSSIINKEQSNIDDSELGIVGPATTAGDVLNADELVDPPKNDDAECQHVAEWIEQSSQHNTTQSQTIRNPIKEQIQSQQQQSTRKSQRIVSSIIKRSIKCLNKMHAMDCGTTSNTGNGKATTNDKKLNNDTGDSPKVPQNRQNGAALPEETATAASAGRVKIERVPGGGGGSGGDEGGDAAVKKENNSEAEEDITEVRKKTRSGSKEIARKRRSNEETLSSNGNPKRICFEQRERYIDSLVGCERISADELATRADELRAEVQALDELARAKEMEWNEILSMRKLKEEAYLRIERRRQVMGFLENNNGQISSDNLPPASLSLLPEWESSRGGDNNQEIRDNQESLNATKINNDDRYINRSQLESLREDSRITDDNGTRLITKRDDDTINRHQKSLRHSSSSTTSSSKQSNNDNGRKQRRSSDQNMENRQIGEGRQGPTVDVRSIIADYRLRHPETVPRRGRRMRNSVNIGLGAGGGMVDTSHGDSRPSSTDSCKSNTNTSDVNNAMSFKDVLVQFAKLSQQQGEPVKTPQNYPDVTLHPVAPSPITISSQSATSQQSGSLLHGILTKSQSPRPTTFSPTLARLLTAPERDRNTPPSGSVAQHQTTQAQHILQAYQGSNSVSITDLLSSSKARTEITITPVVNTSISSSHTNNIVHVDDVEEENSLVEERDTRRNSSARDNREDRDTPPRCQGCHDRAAQFVCAGCGNQWYCSRECQVSAWDEHSEVCSG